MIGRMTLHWSPRSPFVRKVMIAAHEIGLTDRLDCVRTVVAPTRPHAGLMRQNPQSRLPTLVLDDGTVIYDSPVICEYLDTLHDGPRLFPAAWDLRLPALRWQALGDGMLDTLLLWLSERNRPQERQSSPHLDAFRIKTRASVDALEHEVEALAAAPFGIGHIAIGVALGYLDFRFADLGWREGHPRLAGWQAQFDARASVRANQPVDDS
jgi:glutathione S-transferase